MRPYELSLTEAARAIGSRALSPVELTDSVLERIEATEPQLGAYVAVFADAARAAAAEAEREIAAGRTRGPLHGVPMGLKDLIDAAGHPTTASSRVRAHRAAAAEDSTVARRLREAGALLLGKTHTHEFAYGLTTPQTRNAWAADRVAGGSSGGSAVAVAAGGATFALGTDTGGSIRVPASLNGVVGLKPTYGLVPRHGVTPLSWSLDHVGTLTRTVPDAALVLDALAGHGALGESGGHGGGGPAAPRDLTGVRVGVPRDYYFTRVEPGVEAAVRAAIDRLAALGAQLVDVDVPLAAYVQAVQWGLMVPEATAYHEETLRSAPELYGDDVRVLLAAGQHVPASAYLRAQRARALMRQEWERLFDGAGGRGGTGRSARTGGIDVLAAPTVPSTAALSDRSTVRWPDGTEETVSDSYVRLSAPANITGFPSLTLPVGRDGAGLPIGMQLIGRPLGEATLLRAGGAYEATVTGEESRGARVAPVPEAVV